MGFFNAVDIENAADNPFSHNVGRQVIEITKSEFDTIEIKNGDRAGDEVQVWNITTWNEEKDTEQKVTFWEATPEDIATPEQLKMNDQTLSNIKKMLTALEIPTSEWADIVEKHPEKLEGMKCNVEAKKSKKGTIFLVWLGVPVKSAGSSVAGLSECASATTTNPSGADGFGFGGK
jgi:hypothetical protein